MKITFQSKRLKSLIWLGSSMFFLPNLILAQDVASANSFKSASPAESLLPMLMGLVIVLAVIFALAYAFKRFTNFSPAGKSINIVETQVIGSKEKLMIVEVGQKRFLIGVTAQSINQLGELAEEKKNSMENLTAVDSVEDTHTSSSNSNSDLSDKQNGVVTNKSLNFNQVISHFLTGGRSTQKQFGSKVERMDKSA